ncbi:hypothetical protein V7166_18830 [Bacillus thuringiensis]
MFKINRKNIKKNTIAAFVLSTTLFVAPSFSSAATDVSPKVQSQPVLMKENGAKLSMNQNGNYDLPIPQAPVGPYQEFPYEAYSTTQYGELIDYVFVDIYAKKPLTLSTKNMASIDGGHIMVLPDGTRAQEIKDHYNINVAPGKLAYTVGYNKNDPSLKEDLAGTKLKKEIYWKLIDSNIVDKNNKYIWSKQVISGISKSNTLGLALTVGVEAGMGDTFKLSTSLTSSFERNTTITDETSTTKTFEFNPKPDYPYDQYRTALYQQVAKYSIQPGDNLLKELDRINKESDTFEFKVRPKYDYPVDVLLALTSK